MGSIKETLKEAKELLVADLISEIEYDDLKRECLTKLRKQPKYFSDESNLNDQKNSQRDTFYGETQYLFKAAQVIGNYELCGEIGRGGASIIYRACHNLQDFTELVGYVAIKLIKPEYCQDPYFKQKLIREAAIGRLLNHPNIINIHEIFEESKTGSLALVMDFVEGKTLRECISEGLDFGLALGILKQLCDAVQYLHLESIIHGDLKPSMAN